MRQTFSNLKNSFKERLKRRHRESQSRRGTSSSAASGALALVSPPSVQSEDGRPQTVHPQEAQPEEVHPQDAQSHDVQLPEVAETDATLIRTESDPWALAFSVVQKRESELMLAYEEYLSSLQADSADDANLSAPDFIISIVNRAIKDREEKRWRVPLLGTDIEVRKQFERLAKLLLWSEPIVKSAVSNQPYAALAWSGVSILLPLVTSSITQNEAMLKGFNSIGDVQMCWRICEETYLPSLGGPSHQHLIERLARLYSYIIEYQARVICHLSKRQLTRAWNDISSPGEWETNMKEIDRLNQECQKVLGVLNFNQIDKQWKQQLREMQESRTFLDKIYSILEESRTETQKNLQDREATNLLQDLASDYQGHKDFNPQKVDGTCEWFFADERFRNWRDSNDSRLLWVSAGPGCGKSVLSRALIDERRLSTNVTTSTVCYFFFKDGDEGRMYAHNALCAILHQLFTQDFTGNLIEQALPSHKNFGKALTEAFSELWNILIRCANLLDCGEIICLIDALDECHTESRTKLIDALKELYQQPSERPSRLKFLITSRPYDNIELPFRSFSNLTTYLRFDGDDKSAEIGDEINLVIDARVNEFAQDFKEKDRRLIADRLKSTGNRTYLWLYLTIDIIKRSPSEFGRRVDVETLLSSLPSEISEAYDKILEKSKGSPHTEALFHILLAATRPLSLEEANYALTLATKEQFDSTEALEDELWPLNTFKDKVKNLCGLFISVYDEKLSFIHQTAREFLLSHGPEGSWQGRFTMPKSHSTLSSVCLRYLLLPDLPAQEYDECDNCDAAPYGFISYAAKYWTLHHAALKVADDSPSWKDVRMVCCAGLVWVPYYSSHLDWWGLWPERALVTASYFALDPVVQDLLRGTADDDESDTDIDLALCAASGRGHNTTVQMLLDHGADVNANIGGTALFIASADGHTETVRMLLDHGADVNAVRGPDYTALHAVSFSGHTEIAQMLLDHGADVNAATSDDNSTALHSASREGYTEIVQMLLDHGADVNTATSDDNSTALHSASREGYPEIVQMLLDHGADVNAATSDDNDTALHSASRGDDEEIVQMLLDHGADVNAPPATGYGTALQAASAYGTMKIVQMLLDHGADVDAIASDCGTALYEASCRGRTDIVQVLLENGADVSIESCTPLQTASEKGYEKIVQMLLDHGAGIATHDSLDDAMQKALENGRTEIVQLLREKAEVLCMERV